MKHEADYDIGVAVIDSYTHYVLQYLEGINKTSKATMEDFVCHLLRYFDDLTQFTQFILCSSPCTILIDYVHTQAFVRTCSRDLSEVLL